MLFFPPVRPSTVHNSQHVRLMFDTESQLFLMHGQVCGLDSNDGGSLESGPGSWLGDSGYRQEALLERGLGAEAIRKVRSGASLLTKRKSCKIMETASSYIKKMSEKDKSLAEIRRGTTTDFGGSVIEVRDQSSPAHKAQEEIRKEGAHVSLARYQPEETQGLECWRNVARVLTCGASCLQMKNSSVSSGMTRSNGCGWTVERRRRSHCSDSRVSFGCVAPTVRKAPLLRASVVHFPFFRVFESADMSSCSPIQRSGSGSDFDERKRNATSQNADVGQRSQCCAGDFGSDHDTQKHVSSG